MKSRPSAKAAILFALSVPIALLIIVAWPSAWFTALYYPAIILIFLVLDFMMCPPYENLSIKINSPVFLHAGKEDHLSLELKVLNYKHEFPVEILLEISGDVKEAEIIKGILNFKGQLIELPIQASRRGRVKIEAVWLRWQGLLGFIEKNGRYEISKTINVVPDIKAVHDQALQFFSRDSIYGIKVQKFKGEGTEFENLCDYSQSMDNRMIDWKRSAKHRKLLCREFRQERNHQLILGFDTGHLMLEPIAGIAKLDHAIKAGLLLSWVSLYHGDLVGGCGFDGHFRGFLRPGRGMSYFTQMQRFAAGLEYSTEETNFTLGLLELNSRLKQRALVVLFTEFIDTISADLLLENLQLMSKKHVIIFVSTNEPVLNEMREESPSNFKQIVSAVLADDFLRERAIVLEKIARMGIHCINLPVGAVSAALLNKYLMIKQRGLL